MVLSVFLIGFNHSSFSQSFMQNGRVGYDSTIYHPNSFGIGFGSARNLIDNSALIEMKSTDKGLLIPRLSADQIQAINQPANSLLVYNTTDSVFNYFDQNQNNWRPISNWLNNNSNAFLNPEINNAGIGTNSPETKLHIYSDANRNSDNEAVFRIETYKNNKSHAWDISNNQDIMTIKYAKTQGRQVAETETFFSFTSNAKMGIGTDNPQANLHISAKNTNKAGLVFEAPENNSPNAANTFFGIENKNNKAKFFFQTEDSEQITVLKYNNNNQKLKILENASVTQDGFLGLGTENPEKQVHLTSAENEPTIRFESEMTEAENKADIGAINYWDIRSSENTLNFDYTYYNINQNEGYTTESMVQFSCPTSFTDPEVIVSIQGDLSVQDRVSTQSLLVAGKEVYGSLWTQNREDNSIFYNDGNVGIGTSEPEASLQINSSTSNGIIIERIDENYDNTKAKIGISSGVGGKGLRFLMTENGTNYNDALFVQNNSKIGIGTTAPQEKLDVAGNIKAESMWLTDDLYIQISAPAWKDIVFEPDYELMTIDSLEQFISVNKHLPDVPSAEEIEKTGVPVKEMNTILLQKIEEQTLYIIDLQKQIIDLQSQINEIKKEEE